MVQVIGSVVTGGTKETLDSLDRTVGSVSRSISTPSLTSIVLSSGVIPQFAAAPVKDGTSTAFSHFAETAAQKAGEAFITLGGSPDSAAELASAIKGLFGVGHGEANTARYVARLNNPNAQEKTPSGRD